MIKTAIKLHKAGQLKQAKAHYRTILNTEPDHPDALHLYGLACHQLGDHKSAVRYIRKAVELVPEEAVLRNNLGDALRRTGRLEEAIEQLTKALQLRPGYAGAHQNLGTIYLDAGQHDLALEHCKRATELAASRPETWFNLGLCYLDQVSLEDAANAFRRALELRPNYKAAVTSLIYVLNLLPDSSPQVVSNETRLIAAEGFDQSALSQKPHLALNETADRPIRVAYVSGDFRRHAVNYFFEPLLDHHNKQDFVVFCYSDVSEPDDATQRLQSRATHWRDITGLSDKLLTSQIQADQIDILVDLAGYTQHSRLGVFARQAAPVQISWLGFPNTTGLESMNYRIVDVISAPEDQPDQGTEQLLRLPENFACYRPPEYAPPVSDAPCIKDGFVTLGSLHKLEKLNQQVIELWADLLVQNPSAQLLLARDQLDGWQRNRLIKTFKQKNIEQSRLRMIELDTKSMSFFELFADIDILLDVFPWSGHTLACCSLWMGVPVASMSGGSHASRMVTSVLNALGMDDWVAPDRQAYARMLSNHCSDLSQLATIRGKLRNRFTASSLRDEVAFTQQLESEYRRILNF